MEVRRDWLRLEQKIGNDREGRVVSVGEKSGDLIWLQWTCEWDSRVGRSSNRRLSASDFQNQISSNNERMEGKFAMMEEILKKLLEVKTAPATSEARETIGSQGRRGNPNMFRGRKNPEVEILEGEDDTPPLEPLSREDRSTGFERWVANFSRKREDFYYKGVEFERGRGESDEGAAMSGVVDELTGGAFNKFCVDLLSRLQSHYLVSLLGYCADQHHRLLVFEDMPNGCLQQHLHPTTYQADKPYRQLDWKMRLKIALDCARGLEFLHEHSIPPVIHRDFKSSNIVLDHNFSAKVSDFGIAKTCTYKVNGQVQTRVVGTTGYVAPEYAATSKLTTKSDVYSYGVVLLELLTGRVPVDITRPQGEHVLVSWALPRLTNREKVIEMVDPALQGQYSKKELIQVAAIASVCVQSEADYRPLITDVVQSLIPLVKNTHTTCSSTPARFKEDQVSIIMR
ncbi:hypothetical protein M5K25_018796 [Dendrobium thyrsiflorum]|uniref:Protein kinase domain-containing protein n=1 Tax=Dendrobium thyrsiflorum TaxID=117978 RepID=A0ABD0UD36_DENTH